MARGDFFQLCPVPNRWTRDPGDYCFQAPAWRLLLPGPSMETTASRPQHGDYCFQAPAWRLLLPGPSMETTASRPQHGDYCFQAPAWRLLLPGPSMETTASRPQHGEYCFQAPAWENLFPHRFILRKIHRQTDAQFIEAVNATAKGKLNEDISTERRCSV